jgi:hypothetical protein
LAGCSSSDGGGETAESSNSTGSTSESTPELTEAPTGYVSNFRSDLSSINIDIRELKQEFPVVDFEYETSKTQYQAVSDQIGMISGFFFKHIENGWDATRLNAEAHVIDESELIWYARAEWYNQYVNDEITANELTLKILETVSRNE